MIGIAILGCGRIAKRHADLLGNGRIAGARLAAVCDVQPARTKSFANLYRVPGYDSLAEMLAQGDIDAVSILTPSGLHASHAIEVAHSKRHVIVEKPMALTLEDASAMICAAESAGVRLFVVKQNRFNVPVLKAREALEAGRFGKLVLGTVRVRWCRDQAYYDQDSWRGTWALDGGILSNQASHHIDMLSWFMGDVASVHARGLTALVHIEAEDTAVATLKFTSGALGVIEATGAARPKDMEGSISVRTARVVTKMAPSDAITKTMKTPASFFDADFIETGGKASGSFDPADNPCGPRCRARRSSNRPTSVDKTSHCPCLRRPRGRRRKRG